MMSSFALGDVRDYTSMHAYLMTTAGSTARVEESSMSIAITTGVGGRSLQDPDVEEEEISLWKSMEFLF